MSNCLILIPFFFFFFALKVQQFSEKAFLLQLLKTHENALERQCDEITNQRNMLLQTFVRFQPLGKFILLIVSKICIKICFRYMFRKTIHMHTGR